MRETFQDAANSKAQCTAQALAFQLAQVGTKLQLWQPGAAQVAIEFARAHYMDADEAARFVADAFLKARRTLRRTPVAAEQRALAVSAHACVT